ncbi:MAG: AAA family ATPase [bacterium]|nr:AAA family ATPase [bacterium]
MRILGIELAGFLSYSTPQTIDFTKANVFCISGPNGAGKSSILDGIVYALYGKIPRYAGRRISTEEDIINHSSNKLSLSLKFRIGDRIFLVKRELVRGKSQQANIYEIKDSETVPLGVKKNREVNALIENLLGMDYETFTRTVILPQNQIDRFLKPPSSEAFSERRQVLQKLLGLDIYKEVKRLANQRCRDISKDIQIITSRLEGELKSYNREYIRILDKELKEKEGLLRSLDKDRQNLSKEVESLRDAVNLFSDLISSQKDYQVVISKLKWLEKEKEEVDRLELIYQIQIDAVPLLNSIKDFSDKKSRLESLRKERLEIEKSIEKWVKTIEVEKKKAEEYQKYIRYAETLLELTPLAESIRTLEVNKRRIAKALEEIKAKEEDLLLVDREMKEILSEIKACDEKIETLKVNFEKKLEVWKELHTIVEEIKTLKHKKEELDNYRKRKIELEKDRGCIELELKSIENVLNTLTEELDRLEGIMEELHLQRIINSLSIGDTCPICGNTIRKLPERVKDKREVDELLSLYQETKRNWQESFGRFSALKSRLKQVEEESKLIEDSIKNLEEETSKIEMHIHAILGKYFNKGYVVDSEFVSSEVEKERKELEGLIYNIEKERAIKIASLNEKKALFEKEVNTINSVKAQLEEETLELEKQERVILENISKTNIKWEEFLSRNFLKESQELKNKYQKLLDSANGIILTSKASIEAGKARIEKIDSEISELENKLISLKKEIDVKRREVESRCQSIGLSLDELLKIKVDRSYIEKIRKEFNEFSTKQNLLKDEISKLRESLIKLGKNPDKLEELDLIKDLYNSKLNSLKDLEEKIALVTKEIGSLENQIKVTRENLSLAEELSVKKKKLEKSLNYYKIIDDALNENKFPEFLMREVMESIIGRASIQLSSLTQGRYSFSLASEESADIVINDNWYPDQRRKTYSLSGGESFLASISLAIAIAEEIRGKRSVDCLFIDEGFGALDDTGLDNVVSALAELENSGIMIGIITHNKELASRFPYRIEVEKDEKGSRVKGVW